MSFIRYAQLEPGGLLPTLREELRREHEVQTAEVLDWCKRLDPIHRVKVALVFERVKFTDKVERATKCSPRSLITAALEEPDFEFMRHVENTARRICVMVTSIHHVKKGVYTFMVAGGIEQAHALYDAIAIPDGYEVCISFQSP